MFKWSPEAIMAAVAVAVSAGGGLMTTAIHWGAVNQDIAVVKDTLAEHNAKIDAVRADAEAQKIHNAKVEQSLADVKDSLVRIEQNQRDVEDKLHVQRPAH